MSAHDPADPLAHAASTLLAACGLPQAWRGADAWTVLDLDFARGAAFLATLRAWRDDPARPARLHYAALLAEPSPRDALHAGSATDPADAADARTLRERWPIPVTGVHRIAFASGHVMLTLAVGPPAAMLPGRVPHADALFVPVHGAPTGAPAPAVLRAACALLAEGALVGVAPLAAGGGGDAGRAAIEATAHVLAGAGCRVSALADRAGQPTRDSSGRGAPGDGPPTRDSPGQAAPGDGPRDETRPAGDPRGAAPGGIDACRTGAAPPPARRAACCTLRAVRIRGPVAPRPAQSTRAREAMVIGAGLAGCAVAFALARRGWTVQRLGDTPGGTLDGSGQPVLAFHPSVTPDDAPLSRLTRNALLLARGLYDTGAARFGGRLQLDEPAHARAAAAGLPAEWVEAVDAAQAAAHAGVRVVAGGLWLPLAGSADPDVLREGWTIPGVRSPTRRAVARIDAIPGGWRACDADGVTLAEAPVAILATGARDLALRARAAGSPAGLWSHFGAAGLRARTGRTTIATVPSGAMPACVLGGDGHAVPLADGRLLLGPAEGHAGDPGQGQGESEAAWRRFAAQLAHGATLPTPHLAAGPSGTRLSSRDHLPLAGPVPDLHALAQTRDALRRDDRLPLPVLPGLFAAGAFGGRGLLWSVLVAELLAARLEAEPSPLERALATALDPGRFLRRGLRRDERAV